MNRKLVLRFGLAMVGMMALAQSARAQVFTYTNNDLLLGFRKPGTLEPYEVVVNIGKATNYAQAAPGASFAVPNLTLSQLTPGSFANLNNLKWAVVGFSRTNLGTVLPGYINNILWLTVPRSSPGVQSTPPTRLTYSDQGGHVAPQIAGIGNNAIYLSSQTTSNQFNTPKFIREPVNDPADLTSYMGGIQTPSDGTLRDTWSQNNLEISTPATFTTCLISDLYEVWPINESHGFPVTDPHTGLTSGPAYYVGYFQLCPDGTMTFVRASASVTPPAPQLTVTRAGTANLISFPTANGATYTLYYTNAAGLGRPLSTWPSSPTTITGDGSTRTFTNSPSDSERFYRVGVQ